MVSELWFPSQNNPIDTYLIDAATKSQDVADRVVASQLLRLPQTIALANQFDLLSSLPNDASVLTVGAAVIHQAYTLSSQTKDVLMSEIHTAMTEDSEESLSLTTLTTDHLIVGSGPVGSTTAIDVVAASNTENISSQTIVADRRAIPGGTLAGGTDFPLIGAPDNFPFPEIVSPQDLTTYPSERSLRSTVIDALTINLFLRGIPVALETEIVSGVVHPTGALIQGLRRGNPVIIDARTVTFAPGLDRPSLGGLKTEHLSPEARTKVSDVEAFRLELMDLTPEQLKEYVSGNMVIIGGANSADLFLKLSLPLLQTLSDSEIEKLANLGQIHIFDGSGKKPTILSDATYARFRSIISFHPGERIAQLTEEDGTLVALSKASIWSSTYNRLPCAKIVTTGYDARTFKQVLGNVTDEYGNPVLSSLHSAVYQGHEVGQQFGDYPVFITGLAARSVRRLQEHVSDNRPLALVQGAITLDTDQAHNLAKMLRGS